MTPLLCFSPTMPLAAAGNARRAAAVGGDADRPDAGRHRDRRAAARAGRGALGAPGVARAAEQRRVGQRLVAELRRRRLAEQDGARPASCAPRQTASSFGTLSSCMQRAEGGAHARGVHEVLGGEGDAVQQAERLALHDGVLGLLRRRAAPARRTRVMKQFSTGCSFSARASTASVSSTGETFLAAIFSRSTEAGRRREVGHFKQPARREIAHQRRRRRTSRARSCRNGSTRLVSVPSLGERIDTRSPTMWVKPWPSGLRCSVGANSVPVISTMPSGYWCVLAHGVAHQVGRIAADLRQIARAAQAELVGAGDLELDLGLAHVVEREGRVEQAHERADRAGGVVVLGDAQQQRAAALHVAQIDVVAERGADDLAARR